ncbi:MAG: homoserine O-succinyltransferase [Finegoldia sp.]|nr:homoserine O-succinyltransferase [Finegoldia sp.]
MPIIVKSGLPAIDELRKENIFLMTDTRATSQEIRPLRIALVNLMPKKLETETQFLRLLSNTPLQIEFDLIAPVSHKSKNTSNEYLTKFYNSIYDVKDKRYDGMIITGAPLEQIEYEEVDYWDEMKDILKFSEKNVFSTMYICWSSLAALYYFYGIDKTLVDEKIFGVFEHTITEPKKILRGFDDCFYMPNSRYATIDIEKVKNTDDLDLLSYNKVAGPSIISSKDERKLFVLGHFEYDRYVLEDEYKRDIDKGIDIEKPENYYINDDPRKKPIVLWRAHANLLFSNWINYYVYQAVPYDN